MTECPKPSGLLTLPRLRVQNMSAISSPLTWGFPSMTAPLGFMWALERRLDGRYPLVLDSVGIVCHAFAPQTVRTGFHHVFCLTRNPVDKDGGSASIIEEGRAHLEITLLFGVTGQVLAESEEYRADLAREIMAIASQMRFAGGSVVPHRGYSRLQPDLIPLSENDDGAGVFEKLRYRLLPGFTLVERPDLLEQRLEELRQNNPEATRLDAWLSLSRLNWRAVREPDTAGGEEPTVQWQHDRKGWIVPIPLGYAALTKEQPAGEVISARDSDTPFYYVESVYGIGQWIAPHRLTRIHQLLWYATTDQERGLFRCHNDYHHF